ncbi:MULTISPECIES: CHASE2 domain-containing protein [unclassified Moorena]|uniref:CHASE2 domain-containing protein n=1 Tax=unclassified Moorena TaxID=2683338 RepID=UPI001400F137|nr:MULTISPECIES: CHASE2 domain-containing protein [unclassified Moorena]NEO15584.1 CHASE2 domain-containing protein [Moorena sp. SIO3E8]NEQ00998.1 CHASE2 domain-containing protein [Moorena sp. SIO3F7]
MKSKIFHLKVIKIKSGCNFELSWENGKTIAAIVDYPQDLDQGYQDWKHAYINCYRDLRVIKIKKSGSIPSSKKDHAGFLREAEARFLSLFDRWLRDGELYEIREEIAKAATDSSSNRRYWVDIILTCNCPELTRLPWEAWEISTTTRTNLSGFGTIRIARVSNTIHAGISHDKIIPGIRRRARVLAILGDEKGLDFEEDRKALAHLSKLAEIKFIGWQPEKDSSTLKQEIVKEITNPRGWDILFFAGHSNETAFTGGELHIAPDASLGINEIKQSLQQGIANGLKFAIFNSCDGISIAESLIALGLPQVAVMAEPIHNQVAQVFIVQFLNSLAEYKDVHEALRDACAFLKDQQNLTYPSAYLIPTLFRHPQSVLFRLEPFGLGHSLRNWLPTKKQALWLSAWLTVSLIPPVQDLLLEFRLLLQAGYREVTQQVQWQANPSPVQSPVRLVQIDNKSLEQDNVKLVDGRYMDYGYLASILDKLVTSNARIIGFDYILDQDKQQPDNSKQLRQSITEAINRNTWLVWAAIEAEHPADYYGVSAQIANLNQTMEGDITTYDWYVELPSNKCDQSCPFSYLLVLSYCLRNQDSGTTQLAMGLPELQDSNQKFRTSVIDLLNGADTQANTQAHTQTNTQADTQLAWLGRVKRPAIAYFLQWFQPIIDYSLPPEQVYQKISACELLGSCSGDALADGLSLNQTIVIVASGGYKEAGIDQEGQDNNLLPLPVAFWRRSEGWQDWFDSKSSFTGGEAHSYIAHHLFSQHLVIPIPNALMILLTAVLGKGFRLIKQDYPKQGNREQGAGSREQGRKIITIDLGSFLINLGNAWLLYWLVYCLVSLQVYISLKVLLPTLMPLVVFRIYSVTQRE